MEELLDGETRAKLLQDVRKFSAGTLIKTGNYWLNDPDVVEVIEKKEREKEAAELEKKKRERAKILGLSKKVSDIRKDKGSDFSKYNKSECSAFLQYKKKPKDEKMPSDLPALQARCGTWAGRRPSVSRGASSGGRGRV